jgi:hypothetical protein
MVIDIEKPPYLGNLAGTYPDEVRAKPGGKAEIPYFLDFRLRGNSHKAIS